MQTIHRIELNSGHGKVNIYLLVGPEITLIDAGENTEGCYEQLVEALAALNLSISDIKKVILTHLHEDHSGLIYKIMTQSNALLYVNAKAKYSFIETDEEPHSEYDRQLKYMTACYARWGTGPPKKLWGRFYPQPIPSDRIIYLKENDYVFAGDTEYQVIETPGHTQLDICLYNEAREDFFSGDLILPKISPVAYVEAPFPGEVDRADSLIQYMNSLKKVPTSANLVIYPGHGDKFVGSEAWIKTRLLKVESKCARILNVIKEQKSVTVNEICESMYSEHYKKIPYTILSDIVSHLELMEKELSIVCREQSSVDYYEVYKI